MPRTTYALCEASNRSAGYHQPGTIPAANQAANQAVPLGVNLALHLASDIFPINQIVEEVRQVIRTFVAEIDVV